MLKKLRFLPILMILAAMILVAFSPSRGTEAANKIADGIFLGDQDLGGMTLTEAAEAMKKYYKNIANSDLTINVRDIPSDALRKMEAGEAVDVEAYDVISTIKVPVSTFGFEYSIEEALKVASTLGQTGKLVERFKLLMDMKYASAQLPLSYSVDGEKVKEYVESTFVPENTKEAKDATFGLSEGRVVTITGSENGIKVNANLTANSILKAFENGISDHMSCTAVVGTIEPRVTSDAINSISGVVAAFTTKFWTYDSEDNENRSQNIRLAAQYVNNTIVMPGETLSLNNAIGIRTEERGFKVGHAYLDGRVIDSVGGGICQFATTLYQCLLQTELSVNVRKNHSMMVDYVGYSQDATLDWGNVDLVFTNNWNYPIYIACSTTFGYPSTVTVTFYSTDTRDKNRTVEYKSVVDSQKSYKPQVKFDYELAPGTPVLDGVPLDEVSSHLEKIVRVNGVIQSTEIMNRDYYRYLRQTIIVGAKGLTMYTKWENEICKMYDANWNQLLMNSDGMPYYNGYGGYLLCKDYQHDANGYSTTASPTGYTPTPPPTQPAPTEPPTTAPTTAAPTTPEETEAPAESHEHSWGEGSVTKEPSCVETGIRTYTCSCGETRTEEIPALWHSWNEGEVTAAASCTAEGIRTYTCTRCGETMTEPIAASGHRFENGSCTVCGAADPDYSAAPPADSVPEAGGEEPGGENPQ